MKIDNSIRELAKTLGTDFYGVADLTPAYEVIIEQGGELISELPRAISIGITLIHSIVDRLPQRSHPAIAKSYRHHCYDLVNQRLDHITSRLSSVLQHQGCRALPVPASQTVDTERLVGIFSNKLAAHLAGLGWIGKSCLLVTLEVGPRVRWASVLTDAPLEVTGEPVDERCGSCKKCVQACPPKAFTGEPFRPHEPREARFLAHKCKQYFSEMKETMDYAVCGMCLYICPHGRKELAAEQTTAPGAKPCRVR